ncbi:MAG: hypothetical protein N2109_11820 [Fimbriimonadales bacterium]|nr:hypothetical protein [Fimbriimonadales bacterium]
MGSGLILDAGAVPFSAFGSHLTFSVLPPSWGHPGLVVRSMLGRTWEAFALRVLRDGAELPYEVVATPCERSLRCDGGQADACFEARDLARIRTRGVGLRWIGFQRRGGDTVASLPHGQLLAILPETRCLWLFRPLRGRLEVASERSPDSPLVLEALPDADGELDLSLELCVTTPRRPTLAPTYEAAREAAQHHWEAFLAGMPEVPEELREATELAMAVNYGALVEPLGLLRRRTMLMSKNWMTRCWSWDHCFCALAHAPSDPDLAWDQLMVPFDFQDEHGCLPDCVSGGELGWNYVKPPIHGWALGRLLAAHPRHGERDRLEEIYPRLAAWTLWWLEARDFDGDGLPEYLHGNDSGWDNGTVFDAGTPLAAPDLAAFLVVQLDALADVARRLGRFGEADAWSDRAESLLGRMLGRLWDGSGFRALRGPGGETAPGEGSSILLMPLLLGERLPGEVRSKLAARLRPGGPFVTEFGAATESPQSPHYDEDSYWRGPIWPSQTMLLVEGLARSGFRDQAADLARRFVRLCQRTRTFAENYGALTGRPLRDPAYTWASSVFLALAREYGSS